MNILEKQSGRSDRIWYAWPAPQTIAQNKEAPPRISRPSTRVFQEVAESATRQAAFSPLIKASNHLPQHPF